MHVLLGAALHVQPAVESASRSLAARQDVPGQQQRELVARLRGSFDSLVWMLAAAAGQAAGEPPAMGCCTSTSCTALLQRLDVASHWAPCCWVSLCRTVSGLSSSVSTAQA
jgi:hypothetical protein